PSKAVTLADVRTGINYAMIISTNGGLWRYMIGDTVEFTSLAPHKIRITGRTKCYINAFGEELIVDNADRAVAAASAATGAKVLDYTAAPIFMEGRAKGGHEWFVEFDTPPSDAMLFAEVLDKTLQEVNSDYAAKRFKNSTLMPPKLVVARKGAFYRWMQNRHKLGGQNKVPRLANDRLYIDQLLNIQ
ncbi:MAG: GH3 auxin-responsive promoter family protein, partial [Rikenella sp.]|nr:GH3 auxin-responsive promoter family protein [Rikenella sp.]